MDSTTWVRHSMWPGGNTKFRKVMQITRSGRRATIVTPSPSRTPTTSVSEGLQRRGKLRELRPESSFTDGTFFIQELLHGSYRTAVDRAVPRVFRSSAGLRRLSLL